MKHLSLSLPPSRRLAITVRGVVQGVGFRPFVYQTACAQGLTGWVRNEADVVRIEVQGQAAALNAFVETLRHAHPPQARIAALDIREMPLARPRESVGDGTKGFQIHASEGQSAPRPTIPADLATCHECLEEICDPSQRRYNYPFTNCTNCGPRWSIIEHLPYDRQRTSMAAFAMCPECRAEYENPSDRRFHAQPIACPRCGPTLQLLDKQGKEMACGEAALAGAVQAILAGQVVALKGLGGFQLLVDATNTEAVAQLRHRKRRPDRPFAIMMPSLDDVRDHCQVSDDEARTLTSHRSPIVLLKKLSSPPSPLPPPLFFFLSPLVAPNNPYLGVMLPYTPLHHLLMAAVARPIVCTSGNLSEEPMAITTDDALARLGAIAAVLLTHNRPIVRPVDDSIVRLDADGVHVLRRARGFAPLPIELKSNAPDTPTILAVGGHLKNTVAVMLGGVNQSCRVGNAHHALSSVGQANAVGGAHPTPVVMSAHIGDLDSVLSVDVFRRATDDLLEFFQVAPDVVACDLHPDYASSRHAERLASQWNVPLVRFQHHHAHVAACMAEHGLQGPVLGFSWDGTGYGPDGTVWGGEALLCDGAEFQRVARLRTFALPGGDRAAREPRRSALGLLFEMFGPDAAEQATAWFSRSEIEPLMSMLTRHVNSPRTSSMGRLFDGVAAICGLPPVISFEGQSAMALEFAADENEEAAYPFPLSTCISHPTSVAADSASGGADIPVCQFRQDFPGRQECLPHHNCLVADWEPLVQSILTDRAAGMPVGRISARFHNALAEMAVSIASAVVGQVANLPGVSLPVVLTGGCFQNAVLTAGVRARLLAAGFQVYTQREVPPGDGGIALGQVFLALRQMQGSFDVSRNPG